MKTSSEKTVVVIVPAYNAERTIARCLEGIGRSTLKPLATIVVDDKSTDGTAAAARQWPCTLVEMPVNGGAAKARNAGAAQAPECDYLCFVDSDAVLLPDTLSRLVAAVEGGPNRAVASGIFSPQAEGLGFFGLYKNRYAAHKWESLKGSITTFNSSVAVMRPEAFRKAGGFDENMRAFEDSELGTRISRNHEVWFEPDARVIHLHRHGFVSLARDTFIKGVHTVVHFFERGAAANRKDMGRGRMLSFTYLELATIALGPLIPAALLLALATGAWAPLALLLGAYWLSRASFIAYLFRVGGFFFGLGAMAYMLFESLVCSAALVWGAGLAALGRRPDGSAAPGMKFPWARFAAKWFHKYYIEQLIFFVTSRCNLKCNFCFYYEEIDSSSKARELTLPEIQTIAKSMWPFYIMNIGGGEPFLRKELDEICGAFIEHAQVRQIVIPTNGWYTEQVVGTVERILSRYPNISLILVMSVDGLREQHDKIRALEGSYDHLIATYRRLLPIRAKYPNLTMLTNTTLTHENENDILKILKHLDDNYDFDDHIMGMVRFKSRDSSALTISLANYRRGIEFLLERKIRRSHYRGVPSWLSKVLLIKDIMRYRVILDLVGRGKFTTPCYAGKLAVTLNEEGRMTECEIRQTEIGNVRDTGLDFNKLFFTKKREEIAQAQLDEKCACTYECYLPFNILLNPMSPPRILKALIMTFLFRNPEHYIFEGALTEMKTTIKNTFNTPEPPPVRR